MGIAEQMGRTLQRTSISVNIKERLDFSCALFGPDGALVANAPHLPVHLGAMSEANRFQVQLQTIGLGFRVYADPHALTAVICNWMVLVCKAQHGRHNRLEEDLAFGFLCIVGCYLSLSSLAHRLMREMASPLHCWVKRMTVWTSFGCFRGNLVMFPAYLHAGKNTNVQYCIDTSGIAPLYLLFKLSVCCPYKHPIMATTPTLGQANPARR